MFRRHHVVDWIVLSILLALTLTSCAPEPPALVIDVRPGTNVLPGETVVLSAEASGGRNLEIQWQVDNGELSSDTGAEVVYTAPDSPGTAIVTVTVTDDRGTTVKHETIEIVAPIQAEEPQGEGETESVEPPEEVSVTPIPASPSITITHPQDTVACLNPPEEGYCTFQIEGEAWVEDGDFRDVRIYVFVFPLNPPGGGWYLQLPPASINNDGRWIQTPSYLGSIESPALDGYTLQIRAAIVAEDATLDGQELSRMTGVIRLDSVEAIDGLIAVSDFVPLEVAHEP